MSALQRYLRGPYQRELQAIFRALIAWPNEKVVPGYPIRTAAERRDLLRLMCDCLIDNRWQLPPETARSISDVVGAMNETTYSAGARAVLDNSTFFDRLNQERNGSHAS